MRPLFPLLRLALLSAALLLAPAAHAGEATDLVKLRQTRAIQVLRSEPKPSAARDARVSAILLPLFDFTALGQATLPEEEWKKHPVEEQKEFVALLARLVQRSIERSLSQVSDFTIEYLAEQESAGTFTVLTRASRAGGEAEPVEISYALRKGASGLRAVDVAVGGSSTVKGYRTQFTRVIAREGWPALLGKMRRKLEKNGD